jgi:beta-xylosidase
MIIATTAAVAAEQATISQKAELRWGDQGDGTYRNPILNADYPDVDIEKVGNIYYMITSTNHYAPGMTLLESKDLVNWTIIGHVFDKLTWEPRYNFDRMSGYSFGIWAGDLAYHDNRWYCYFIDFQSGLYMSTADRITGPWSRPICMLSKTRWTDPAVFWDDDQKQAYLVCNFGRDPERKMNQTRLFRMSADGRKLLDKGKAIYHGHGAEAAKIYKIDGYYYIFMAEWIEGDRKQIVLRGRSIYGPFERRIVMERGNDAVRSVCQGALVQARDGSWWYSHQLVQHREKIKGTFAGRTTGSSYEGRSQWLVPVKWKDGWPVLGRDPDGNGIGNTVHLSKKPIQGCPIDAPQTDDEFDAPRLSPQWQFNHNPRDNRWSLTERPGWLRLKANVPVKNGGFWNASNTVSQRLMGKGKGVVTAKVDISGMKPGQQAGFCRHSGQYILLGIRAGDDRVRRLVFNKNGKVKEGPVIRRDVIYYRTKNDGNQAFFEYSLDGKTYIPFGEKFQLKFGRWRGDRLGFYCFNEKKAEGHIDIDYFHYDYDGPKRDNDPDTKR